MNLHFNCLKSVHTFINPSTSAVLYLVISWGFALPKQSEKLDPQGCHGQGKLWKKTFFPGQGKVREFCGWPVKFRKDLESQGKVREFENK